MSDIVRRKESITQDFEKKTVNGFVGLFLHIIFGFFNLFLLIIGSAHPILGAMSFLILLITGPLWLCYWNSYVTIGPNTAVAVQFFGKYAGTVNE
ncbi:MAG: hypothetical protein HOH07_03915, partial [Euryarchaeota archaeon]|nr:hypothetical protein [Euryarchaeota archaeon]MBT6776005.1 hypothetical protein [Euryarchaeota archaeon]